MAKPTSTQHAGPLCRPRAEEPLAFRASTALAALLTLPLLVLGVGFVFHTDFEPDVFGKYKGGYFAFLLGWWLLLTPGVFFFLRFVLRTQRIELSTGTTWHVRPSLKILLCLLAYAGINAVVSYQVNKQTGDGVATPMRSDEFHPYLQNSMRPGKSRFGTNRWGYRGTEIARKKPAGVYRIFALGGSTTASLPLPLEQSYPELLAAKLRLANPDVKIEVQNAGGEWHTSQHSLIKLLTDIRSFEPDLVICYHGINDLGRSLQPDLFARGPYRDDYRHYLGPVSALAQPKKGRWPLVRMRLGYWFSDFRMHRVRIEGPRGDGVRGMQMAFLPKAKEVEVESWPSLVAFRRNLNDLCEVAKDAGFDLILASQPFLYRTDLSAHERSLLWTPITHQREGKRPSLASMIRGMVAFNQVSAEVTRERGVGYVDLEAAVPKDTAYLYDDVHYTGKASEIIAQAFFEHLQPSGVVRLKK